MKIRKAKLSDVNEISYLNSLLMKYHIKFDRYWNVKKDARKTYSKYVRKMIRSPKATVFVADDGGKIVGFTSGKIEKRPPIFKIEKCGKVDSTFVLKQYRRRGIGKKLIDELIKWFKSKGIEYVELEVDTRNKIALKAWKKFKFKRFLIKKKKKI